MDGIKKLEISTQQMEQIRQIQLEMLREVERICSKYHISYCLGYGSMLGAVRHKGFIPWDDDVDILMLRRDYDKFKKIYAKEMDSKYFLQDYESDPEYLWGYSKLRNLNTTYIRCGQEHIKCKDGVFIDIFPQDEIPASIGARMVQDWICIFLRKALWARVGQRSESKVWLRAVYKLLARIPKKSIYACQDTMIRRYKQSRSGYVRCLLFIAPGKKDNNKNTVRERYGFRKEWLIKRARYEFEGELFWGTKDYDRCLSYLYGDYMTLPPEEKRQGHAPVSNLYLGNEGMR